MFNGIDAAMPFPGCKRIELYHLSFTKPWTKYKIVTNLRNIERNNVYLVTIKRTLLGSTSHVANCKKIAFFCISSSSSFTLYVVGIDGSKLSTVKQFFLTLNINRQSDDRIM